MSKIKTSKLYTRKEMVEFAKGHVKAALESASQVHLSGEIDQVAFDKMGDAESWIM